MASNQTATEKEAEFFAVATVGRKGLEEAVQKMTPEIMAVAAPDVVKAGSTWLKRAVISVANSDNEKVLECLKTRRGLFSVIKCFEQAATIGFQIGGQFPHAHLTAFDGEAELIPDARGYKHVTCYGPGAVLDDLVIRRVYEGEEFSLDYAGSVVKHSYDGKKERGKLKGVYGIMVRKGGEKLIEYMTRDEALRIRDNHSRGYSAFKAGKIKSNFWHTDEDAAVEKTAVKKFLRSFAAESEGISMLFSSDDVDDTPIDVTEPPPRDVGDRMAAHLDRKTSAMTATEAAKEAAQDAEVVEDATHAEPEVETSAEPDQPEIF